MKNLINELAERFDYIIVDLPPVNIVSDALVVSSLLDGMIVVVREDYTERKELERCFRQLKLSNINVLGCVMNETRSGSGYYSRYKRYRYYRYYRYYYKKGYYKHDYKYYTSTPEGKHKHHKKEK